MMSEPFTSALAMLALQHLPIAMLKLDSQGRILRAQCHYWETIGLHQATALEGQLLDEALPGNKHRQPWAWLAEAWEASSATQRDIEAGQRTLHAFASVTNPAAASYGSDPNCYLLLWDRTDQLAEQAELAQASETLAQFKNDLPAMLFQTQGNEERSELKLPFLSAKTQEYTGYTPEQLQQNTGLILDSIHAEDRHRYYDQAYVATEQLSTFQIDMRLVSPDDTVHWVRVVSHPRELTDRSILFTGVAVEIDDLVEQLEQLRRHNDNMGQFSHDRFQTLLETKRSLEQEIQRRELFHAELVEEQRTLKHMLELQDHQRRFLSYDLHDGFVQDIVGAKMLLEGMLAAGQPTGADLEFAITSLSRAIEEVRRMIVDLRPLAVESEGLLDAVDSLRANARSVGIEVSLEHNLADTPLPQEVESHAYRMIQEALSNVRKHASADKASVEIRIENDQLCIEVDDCGVGFVPEEVSGLHFGLEGMRQRARLLRGTANVSSREGEGTRISIRLPLQAEP